MKKLSKIILIVILIMILGNQYVSAAGQALPRDVEDTIEGFFENLDEGDTDVYQYIDTSNIELYNNVRDYLYSIEIRYRIKSFTNKNDTYTVRVEVEAVGDNWNVSGITTEYNLKEIDGEYVITDTNLFDYVGTENVFKFVLKVFAIICAVLLGIFITIAIIVIIIVKAVQKSSKKNNSENSNL